MNELCFLTSLSSSEWASWVQAIGSILAIIGAAWIAIWQSAKQHKSAIDLMRIEHNLLRTELARSLLELSVNCSRLFDHVIKRLPDRESVYFIAEQQAPFDLNELRAIESSVLAIPLQSLPHTLVSPAMILSSTLRQFREKVEMALRVHRNMDAKDFGDFFSTLNEMKDSLAKTCDDIKNLVDIPTEGV